MLDALAPAPPPLPTVDSNQYDDAQVATDADFRHVELEEFLEADAWAGTFEAQAAETPVTEMQWEITLNLDLFSHFDLFQDDFVDRVGYHTSSTPEDWKEHELHPELTPWGEVSSTNVDPTELGQDMCDVLKDDYIDWESEYGASDGLPDFG